MGKVQETHAYAGKAPKDLYEAAIQALPKAGLKVWKRRDIAWLVMVNSDSSSAIDGNVSAKPGAVTVSLNAPGLSDEELRTRAEKLFQEVGAILG